MQPIRKVRQQKIYQKNDGKLGREYSQLPSLTIHTLQQSRQKNYRIGHQSTQENPKHANMYTNQLT